MNVVARSARSVAWIVADSWISMAVAALSYLFLLRMLGPDVFGTVAIAGLFFGIVSTFVGGALTESIQQKDTIEDGHLNVTFWLNTALCLVFAGIIAMLADPLGGLLKSEALASILPALALAALISSFGALPRALLERDLQHHKLAALNVLAGIPSVAIALSLAFLGYGAWSLVFSILTGTCIGTIGVWCLVSWRPGLTFERRHVADLSQFNRDTILTYMLGYLDDAIPRFALAVFGGERAVGLYDLAMQLSSRISGAVMGPLAEVTMNTVARLQSKKADVCELLDRAFTLTTSLIYPAVFGAVIVAPIALPLLLGGRWTDVILPAQIALLIGLRNASGDLNIAILRGFGNSAAPIRILSIGVILQVALVPLVALFGVVGAVVAVALRVFATWPLSANFVEKVCGYGMLRQLTVGLAALVAALLMAAGMLVLAIVLPASLPEPVSLCLLIVFGVILYGLLLMLGQQWRDILASINWFKTQMRFPEDQPAAAV